MKDQHVPLLQEFIAASSAMATGDRQLSPPPGVAVVHHSKIGWLTSALGQKWTLSDVSAMSALTPKADVVDHWQYVHNGHLLLAAAALSF